jgi:hypothetical protein
VGPVISSRARRAGRVHVDGSGGRLGNGRRPGKVFLCLVAQCISRTFAGHCRTSR